MSAEIGKAVRVETSARVSDFTSDGGSRLPTPAEATAWDALRERVSITLRPIGAASALGFLGLAAATWTLASLQLGWVPVDDGRRVAIVLIGFAFAAQLVASIFAFLSRDGGVGTAMGQLALIWLVVGGSLLSLPAGSRSDALGTFLLFAGVSLLLSAVVAATAKVVPALVFALAGIRFLTTGTYELGAGETWEDVSGAIGVALALLALYAAFAAQFEDALHRSVLPLGRRGKAKTALHGSLFEQTRTLANEPGVREQL